MTDCEGNQVSYSWDCIAGEDWIIFRRDHRHEGEKIILKIQKALWEAFSPTERDMIYERVRRNYG